MPAKSRKSTKKPSKPLTTPVVAAPPPSPAPVLAPGTVLRKLDRKGIVRCECTVEVDGFRYGGQLYNSISAAATAAAKALGLAGTSFNGYVFFGLAKASGRDPVHRLDSLWQRYTTAATALLKNDGAERVAGLDRMRQHVAQMKALL